MAIPELLTQAEAAARLGCSISAIKRLRRAGVLSWIPGRPVRVYAADVAAHIERAAGRASPAPAADPAALEARAMAAADMRGRIIAAELRAGRTPDPEERGKIIAMKVALASMAGAKRGRGL